MTSLLMNHGPKQFEVSLELRSGNASELQGSWTPVKISLKGQTLTVQSVKKRSGGDVALANTHCEKLAPSASDAKRFPFVLKKGVGAPQPPPTTAMKKSLGLYSYNSHATKLGGRAGTAAARGTALVFNAHTEADREVTIALLGLASADPDWSNPFYVPIPGTSTAGNDSGVAAAGFVEGSADSNDLVREREAQLAAMRRLQSVFRVFLARRRMRQLHAALPQLFLLSVDWVQLGDLDNQQRVGGDRVEQHQPLPFPPLNQHDQHEQSTGLPPTPGRVKSSRTQSKPEKVFAYVSGLAVSSTSSTVGAGALRARTPPGRGGGGGGGGRAHAGEAGSSVGLRSNGRSGSPREQQGRLLQEHQHQHQTTVPVCIARTPPVATLPSAAAAAGSGRGGGGGGGSGFHIALVAHTGPLDFIAVALVDAGQKASAQHGPLGIAFLNARCIKRPSVGEGAAAGTAFTYSTTLPLEPYQAPDLDLLLSMHRAYALGSGGAGETGRMSSGGDSVVSAVTLDSALVRNNNGRGGGGSARGNGTRGGFSPRSSQHKRPESASAGSSAAAGRESRSVGQGTVGQPELGLGSRLELERALGLGLVSVTVAVPEPLRSMCGWLWKRSERLAWGPFSLSVLRGGDSGAASRRGKDRSTGNGWRRYWFVLLHGELQYFDSPPLPDGPATATAHPHPHPHSHAAASPDGARGAAQPVRPTLQSLDRPKKVVRCAHITDIQVTSASAAGLLSSLQQQSGSETSQPASSGSSGQLQRPPRQRQRQHQTGQLQPQFGAEDRIATLTYLERGCVCCWTINLDTPQQPLRPQPPPHRAESTGAGAPSHSSRDRSYSSGGGGGSSMQSLGYTLQSQQSLDRGIGSMWLRKLYRSCVQLRNPDLEAAVAAGFRVVRSSSHDQQQQRQHETASPRGRDGLLGQAEDNDSVHSGTSFTSAALSATSVAEELELTYQAQRPRATNSAVPLRQRLSLF